MFINNCQFSKIVIHFSSLDNNREVKVMSINKDLTVASVEDESSHTDDMASMSHSLENSEPVQANAQILLTQDGIVWAPGKIYCEL